MTNRGGLTPQSEMRLGIVGAVEGGLVRCRECRYPVPPGARICPTCGYERGQYAGAEYPAGRLERYQWVYDQSIASPTAKWVLAALVHFDRGGGVYPSVARVAEMTALSERGVGKALRWLREAGWIVRARRRRPDGRTTSNEYYIQQPHPSAPRADGPSARGAYYRGEVTAVRLTERCWL